jgi:hypothetical protein
MSLMRGLRILMIGALLQFPSPTVASEAPPYRSTSVPSFPVQAEVLSDASGPIAYRTRVGTRGWRLPAGDAVLLDEAWWTPLRPMGESPAIDESLGLAPESELLERIQQNVAPAAAGRRPARLIDAAIGDVTLDGQADLVISFRRPFERNFINVTRPRRRWADADGLSAHLGLYRPDDLSEIWVAGTLVRPVIEVAACNGALAVAYGELDEPGTVETGAWRWIVFGFLPVEPLPGPGTPSCVDIDGDGLTEPAITGRSVP